MKDRADGCGFAESPPGWIYIVIICSHINMILIQTRHFSWHYGTMGGSLSIPQISNLKLTLPL